MTVYFFSFLKKLDQNSSNMYAEADFSSCQIFLISLNNLGSTLLTLLTEIFNYNTPQFLNESEEIKMNNTRSNH